MWKIKLITNTLHDDSELRSIRDSIPHLGIVELDTGARLIVRDATEILIHKAARQEIIRMLHLMHAATYAMVLQTRYRLFWPRMRQELDDHYTQCMYRE